MKTFATKPTEAMLTTGLIVVALALAPMAITYAENEDQLSGIAADNNPEVEALKSALQEQWEADATAAGLDISEASSEVSDPESAESSASGQ